MFSKSCKYAIRATLYLAANSNEATKYGVEHIATTLNVPKPFLGKILQQLAKNGLISVLKGPKGGFYLTTANKEHSLNEIITSIDGPEVLTSCILGLPSCSSEMPCPLHFQFQSFKLGLMEVTGDKTVAELAEEVKEGKFVW